MLYHRSQEIGGALAETGFKPRRAHDDPRLQQGLMQLLARRARLVQPAKDDRLHELTPCQFSLTLDEPCFFAMASAVVVNRVWSFACTCVMVVMKRGLSGVP